MGDRELLELAARGCGYDTSHHWNALRLTLNPPVASLCIDGLSTAWNPLSDNGDAFRLAVTLKIDVLNSIGDACRAEVWDTIEGEYIAIEESFGTDPCAAMRRAIVRAAAALAGEV